MDTASFWLNLLFYYYFLLYFYLLVILVKFTRFTLTNFTFPIWLVCAVTLNYCARIVPIITDLALSNYLYDYSDNYILVVWGIEFVILSVFISQITHFFLYTILSVTSTFTLNNKEEPAPVITRQSFDISTSEYVRLRLNIGIFYAKRKMLKLYRNIVRVTSRMFFSLFALTSWEPFAITGSSLIDSYNRYYFTRIFDYRGRRLNKGKNIKTLNLKFGRDHVIADFQYSGLGKREIRQTLRNNVYRYRLHRPGSIYISLDSGQAHLTFSFDHD